MVDQEPKGRNPLIAVQVQIRDTSGDKGVCIYPPKKSKIENGSVRRPTLGQGGIPQEIRIEEISRNLERSS